MHLLPLFDFLKVFLFRGKVPFDLIQCSTAHRRKALQLRQLREELLPHPRHEEAQTPQSVHVNKTNILIGVNMLCCEMISSCTGWPTIVVWHQLLIHVWYGCYVGPESSDGDKPPWSPCRLIGSLSIYPAESICCKSQESATILKERLNIYSASHHSCLGTACSAWENHFNF